MKIFSKKWWTTVPICRECNGTGITDNPLYNIEVYWKGTLVKACIQCRGRGMEAI